MQTLPRNKDHHCLFKEGKCEGSVYLQLTGFQNSQLQGEKLTDPKQSLATET